MNDLEHFIEIYHNLSLRDKIKFDKEYVKLKYDLDKEIESKNPNKFENSVGFAQITIDMKE